MQFSELKGKQVRRSRKVAWRVFDDQGVVLDTSASRIFGINSSGARIWELLQAPMTADELAALFAGEYGLSDEQAREDVGEFIGALQERGLVEIA